MRRRTFSPPKTTEPFWIARMWTPCWWPLPTTGMPGLQDACAAGKDVYCEKPMSHTVEQAFAMIDAMQNHQRIVQVGSQCRSSIVYAQAKQIFESGALGQVTM